MGCTIQPGTCETVGLRAIFIAPTKRAIHPTGRKIRGYGRFSSPLRKGGYYKCPVTVGALPGIGGAILYLLPARIWASWEDSSRMTVFSEPVRLFFRASRARVKV